jgi:hypothetical protein
MAMRANLTQLLEIAPEIGCEAAPELSPRRGFASASVVNVFMGNFTRAAQRSRNQIVSASPSVLLVVRSDLISNGGFNPVIRVLNHLNRF